MHQAFVVMELRNFGIRAVESGILRLSSDNRNFLWGSNGRKLMVQGCSAKTTEGVWEGMNMIGDLFDEMRANKV